MKFYEALKETMETGIGIYRKSWPECDDHATKGVPEFVEFRSPANGVDTEERLQHRCPEGTSENWAPSYDDVLADDWETLLGGVVPREAIAA